jgi:hypothetical protein
MQRKKEKPKQIPLFENLPPPQPPNKKVSPKPKNSFSIKIFFYRKSWKSQGRKIGPNLVCQSQFELFIWMILSDYIQAWYFVQ